MNITFDELRKLCRAEFILANPDQKLIGIIERTDPQLSLKFNGLGELMFDAPAFIGAKGGKEKHPHYDKVRTQRLILVKDIGWFKIEEVKEIDDGQYSYKSVRCLSLEIEFNNFGIDVEARPYCLYNKKDEYDVLYNSKDLDKIPSVVGQLIGHKFPIEINFNPLVGVEHDSWLITKISDVLQYDPETKEGLIRSFTEDKVLGGYEFIMNEVATKFEVIFRFDILKRHIQILTLEEAAPRTNIFLSHENIVNELRVTEKAAEIVTVLECNGAGGLDIRSVNPEGDNTVKNFDYYKAIVVDTEVNANGEETNVYENNPKWMSGELTDKIINWEKKVDAAREEWTTLVEGKDIKDENGDVVSHVDGLRDFHQTRTEIDERRQFVELKLKDLQAATDMSPTITDSPTRLRAIDSKELTGREIFTAEEVVHGGKSLDIDSEFNIAPFDRDKSSRVCYKAPPKFVLTKKAGEYATGLFQFPEINSSNKYPDHDDGIWCEGSFDQNFLNEFVGNVNTNWSGNFIYFVDTTQKTRTRIEIDDEGKEVEKGSINGYESYCKLDGEVAWVKDDEGKEEAGWRVKGFSKYTIFSNYKKWTTIYDELLNGLLKRKADGNPEIDETSGKAIVLKKGIVHELEDVEEKIKKRELELQTISSSLKLENQFYINHENPDTATAERKLFFELRHYWIENSYNNEGLVVHDNTTNEERISMSLELLKDGEKLLEKLSQPKYSMEVDAVDFTKIWEFRSFGKELDLGKIITIQKDKGICFYPMLTGIKLNLDDPEGFVLEFSNALRPDSADFCYADLLVKGESAAKSISANFQNFTMFSRRENTYKSLIQDPLDRTLRIAQANMTNQEFSIDGAGILGRRYEDGSQASFLPEQVRIINNTILFTENSWQSASMALGKVVVKNPVNGQETNPYGIVADALVGSLLIGNTLYIANKDATIILDGDGIRIRKLVDEINGEYDTTFHADPEGNVSIKGRIDAKEGTIGGLVISPEDKPEGLYAKNGNFSIKADGSITSSNGNFMVDAEGNLKAVNGDFQGKITADKGKIGGFDISTNPDKLTAGDDSTAVGMSPDNNGYSFWAGNTTPAGAPFNVTNDGKLSAKEGKIGGVLNLSESGIYSQSFSIVESDGIETVALSLRNSKSETIVSPDTITTPVLNAGGIILSNNSIRGDGAGTISFGTSNASTIDYRIKIEKISNPTINSTSVRVYVDSSSSGNKELISGVNVTIQYVFSGTNFSNPNRLPIFIPAGEEAITTTLPMALNAPNFRLEGTSSSSESLLYQYHVGGDNTFEFDGSIILTDASSSKIKWRLFLDELGNWAKTQVLP